MVKPQAVYTLHYPDFGIYLDEKLPRKQSLNCTNNFQTKSNVPGRRQVVVLQVH